MSPSRHHDTAPSTALTSTVIERVGILLAAAFACADAVAANPTPDNIHDLRVASRRTREALAVYRRLYRKKDLRRLKSALRSVTREWGPVRDSDVLCEYFSDVAAHTEEPSLIRAASFAAGFQAALRAERFAAARADAEKGSLLKRSRLARSATRLKPASAKDASAEEFARSALEEREAAFASHLPDALDPAHIGLHHSMRIAAKHLRYSVETLRDTEALALAPDAHKTLVTYQDILGAIHDRDVAAAFVAGLREDGRLSAGEAEELLGVIAHQRRLLFNRFRRLVKRRPPGTITAAQPRSRTL